MSTGSASKRERTARGPLAPTQPGFLLSRCQESREGRSLEKRRRREQGWASWTAAVRPLPHALESYGWRRPQMTSPNPLVSQTGSLRPREVRQILRSHRAGHQEHSSGADAIPPAATRVL